MLSAAHVSRMLEAPDLDRAFFVLNETTYADYISSAVHAFDFDEIINLERKRAYTFLKTYAGNDETLKLLWRKYDYGNVKVLLRALKLKKEDIETGLLSDYGNVPVDVLKKYIFKGEGVIPAWLERAVNDALVAFEDGRNPANIDRALDKADLDDLAKSDSELLRSLSKLWGGVLHPFNLEGDNKSIELLKGVKRKAFGIDPLITYWLVKTFEAKTIRQILVAKKNHLSLSNIKSTGRTAYV